MSLVEWSQRDGVAVLTLNNPPANGYSYAMMRELDEGILRARFDDTVHVVVLAGRGEKCSTPRESTEPFDGWPTRSWSEMRAPTMSCSLGS